jgi:hypothetical protein
MLRTSTFRLPNPRIHWSATSPRNKHYQQPRLLHEHDSGNNTGAGWQEGGGLTRYGGRLDRLHLVTKKSPKLLFRAPKHTTVSLTEISGQGQARYQEIFAKTKTSPRPKGLGAVRPATRAVWPPIPSNELQARTPSKQHENDPRFHLNAPLIKANKLTEENPAKSNSSSGRPRAIRLPPQAVRPPLPEYLPAGQTSTSHRLISRITPQIVAKLRETLCYLLGNLYLKGIDPNRSQSRGIDEIVSLGQELEQLEKPPNRVWFKGDLGGKVTSQRGTRSSYVTPKKIPKKSSSKLCQEKHNKELRKSPQRRTGKAPNNLEEPRRTIYTYHEG